MRLEARQWRSLGFPASFEEYQERVHWLQADSAERREFQRFRIRLDVVLSRLPTWRGGRVQSERTVTENLSHGGAELISRLATHPGDVLLFSQQDGSFETRARVCFVSVRSGAQRLHLRFLDQPLPPALMDLMARDADPP